MKNLLRKLLSGIGFCAFTMGISYGQCPEQPTTFPTVQPVNCQTAQTDFSAAPYFDICQTICLNNTNAGNSGQVSDLAACVGNDNNDLFIHAVNLYDAVPNYDGSIVIKWVDWPNKASGILPPAISVHAEVQANLAGTGIQVAAIDCTDGFRLENAICLPSDIEGNQFYAVAGTFPTKAELDPIVDGEAGVNVDLIDINYWLQVVTADGGQGDVCFEVSRYQQGNLCGDAATIALSGSSSEVSGAASGCLCDSAIDGGLANPVNNLPLPCGAESASAVWYEINAPFDCNIISADVTVWSGSDDYNVAILSGVSCPGEDGVNPITNVPIFTPGQTMEAGANIEASSCSSSATTELALPAGTYYVYVSGKSERPTYTVNVTVTDAAPSAGIASSPDNGGDFCSNGQVEASATGFDLPQAALGQDIAWYVGETITFNPYNNQGIYAGSGTSNVVLDLPANTGCSPALVYIKGVVADDGTSAVANCEAITNSLSVTIYPEIGTPSILNNTCIISVAGRCSDFTINGDPGSTTYTGTAAEDGNTIDFVISNGLTGCELTISELFSCGSATCTQPSATGTSICDANDPFNFYIDVNLTAGSASSYLIVSSDGSSIQTTGGMTRIGPFANGNNIDVSIENSEDNSCNLPLGTFTEFCNPNACPNLTSTISSLTGNVCETDQVMLTAAVSDGTINVDYEIQWKVNGVAITGANTLSYVYDIETQQSCSAEIHSYSAELTCLRSGAAPATTPTMSVANNLTVYPVPVLGLDFYPNQDGCIVEPVDNCGGLVITYNPTTNPTPGDPDVTVNYTVAVAGAPAGCAATGSYVVQCNTCTSDAGSSIQIADNVICADETFSVSTQGANLETGYAIGYAVSTTNPVNNLGASVSSSIASGDIQGPYSATASATYTNGVDYPAGDYFFTPFVSLNIDNSTTAYVESGTLNDPFGPGSSSVTIDVPDFVFCQGITNFDFCFEAIQVSGVGNPIDEVTGCLNYNSGSTTSVNICEADYTADPSTCSVTMTISSTFGANVDYTFTINYADSYLFPTQCPTCDDVGNPASYTLLPEIQLTLPAQPQTCDGLAFDLTVMDPTANIDGASTWYDGDPDAGGVLIQDPTTAFPSNNQEYWALFRAADDQFCTEKIMHTMITIPAANTNDIPAQPALCQGDVVDLTTLEAGISTDGGVFTWYRGDPDSDPFAVTLTETAAMNQSPGDGTTYFVIFQPSVGCSNKESVTYTVNASPALAAQPPVSACDGSTVDLTSYEDAIANGLTGTFTWYDADPTSGGVEITDPTTATPLDNDIYFAVFVDSNSGCSNQIGITFNAYPTPELNQQPLQTQCGSMVVDLTSMEQDIATSAGSFVWYDGDPDNGGQVVADASNVTPADGDLYFAVFTDVLTGCMASTSVEYAVSADIILNSIVLNPFCANSNVDLTSFNIAFTTDAGTFEWYLGDPANGGTVVADPTDVVAVDGTEYCVIFTNTLGCTATGCTTTPVALEVMGVTAAYNCDLGMLEVDFSAASGGNGTYQVAISSPNMDGDMLIEDDMWTIIVEDSNNCLQADTLTGTVDCVVATEDFFQENSLTLYPNPTSNTVTLSFDLIKTNAVSISVLNILGMEVERLEEASVSGSYSRVIDMEAYPSGIYLIDVRIAGEHFVQKLIKE